jgi:hypothetical protein
VEPLTLREQDYRYDQISGRPAAHRDNLFLVLAQRENIRMRRIAVYREGNNMAAQIGPDWVEGIAGFGDTVADALRDLASSFADHRYELRGNSVGVDVAGEFIEVAALPGESPLSLAGIIEERGYQESDFPEPDWHRLANEERVISRDCQMN